MSDTQHDDHSIEFDQTAGLSALGIIEGDERQRFEAHLAHCERCQVRVRVDRDTLRGLLLSAPEMDPSPDFKQRLLQRAAAELAGAEAPPPPALRVVARAPASDAERRPATILPFYRRTRILSALAAVFALALVTVGAFSYQNQTVSQVALHGDAPGEAYVIVRRSGAAELEMRNVPDPGPGYVYEAWIIPPGDKPIAAGVTTSGNTRLTLEGDVRGKTVAITREAGRVPAPTGGPLMAATV